MTSYGFKLFKLDLVIRDGRTPQPWVTTTNGQAVDRASDFRALFKARKDTIERGLPLGPDARPLTPNERRQRPVFTIEKIKHYAPNTLLTIRYGRHRDEDLGLPVGDGDADSVDLTHIAPTRSYRIFIAPPASGRTGMMAVEAVSGACPSDYFVKWARRWVQEDAETARTDTWYKLRAHAAVEPKLLSDYLRQAEAQTIHLTQRHNLASRGRRAEVFRLEAPVYSNQSDQVMERVASALEANTSEEDTDSQFASDLGEILGHGLEGLEFDDGWVVLDLPEIGRQKVSPSRIPEVFVYPIDNERPSLQVFRRETRAAMLRISESLDATLDLSGW